MTDTEEHVITKEDVRELYVKLDKKMDLLKRMARMAGSVMQKAVEEYSSPDETKVDWAKLYAALTEVDEMFPEGDA